MIRRLKLRELVRCPLLVLFAGLMAGLPARASADNFPDRPIQLVVPAGPGSSTDSIMRSLAQAAAPMMGQSIVILNRPGAVGTISPFVAEGKAKCLLLTRARRYQGLPNVESLTDVKMPQAETRLWRAVVAPRDMPQDRFDKLRDIFLKAAMTPEFKALAEKRGEEVWDISAEEANKFAQDEFVRMGQLAKELHLNQN